MQKLESFKNDSWTRFFEYADLLDYLQDEDELADEYDVAINHTILWNTYIKSRRYKRERCQGSAKPTCKALDESEAETLKMLKKKDGVIRPFLLATNEVGGGLGSPTHVSKTALLPGGVKRALRFSKGIEPSQSERGI